MAIKPQTLKTTHVRIVRIVAAALALVLLASACSSDDASSDARGSNGSRSDTREANRSDGSDRATTDTENTFAPAERDSTVDAEDSFVTDGVNSTVDAEVPQAREPIDADSNEGGGLFGTLGSDEVPPATTTVPPASVDSRFTDYGIRTFISADIDPLSTFALDVDTGSYSIGRRYLLDDLQLPPRESVRVEEYVNSHEYDYRSPRDGLDVVVDGGPSPFDEENYLLRIGVQAEEISQGERRPVALTFVVDTSGSMDSDDRLGLVRESLELLVDELDRDDTVAIVTYSGSSGIVLEPTSVRDRDEIIDAIRDMRAGGSTNLQAGLDTGYDLAREAFRDDGVNRVIVASDGLANAGITDVDQLSARIRRDADAGIGIITVGYGLRGFNDTTMEQLADQGDGFYAYVDTIDEAERLFRDDLTSTLITAAIDAKIQVEFDDRFVDEYRLIGYENRGVHDDDFRNDEVDAGELGAGHQATALYEVRLARNVSIDDRAQIGIVSLRWQDPESGEVVEIDEDIDLRDIEPQWIRTAMDFQQATVVATLAELLRDSPYADHIDIADLDAEVRSLAREVDSDRFDEFADMVEVVAERR